MKDRWYLLCLTLQVLVKDTCKCSYLWHRLHQITRTANRQYLVPYLHGDVWMLISKMSHTEQIRLAKEAGLTKKEWEDLKYYSEKYE